MGQIAERIRTARIAKGMTQERLAQEMNVTRQTISNYEAGKRTPDLETMIALSRILGMDLIPRPGEEAKTETPREDARIENISRDHIPDKIAEGTLESCQAGEENSAERQNMEVVETARGQTKPEKYCETPEPMELEKEENHAGTASGQKQKNAKAHQDKWKILWIILAAAVLCLAILFAAQRLLPRRISAVKDQTTGIVYSPEDYRILPERTEDGAYLEVKTSQSYVQAEGQTLCMFEFEFMEVNGVGLDIQLIESVIAGESSAYVQNYNADALAAVGLETRIEPWHSFQYQGGFPQQSAARWTGVRLTGVDDQGNQQVYVGYLEFHGDAV